jgi:hypothetical protein
VSGEYTGRAGFERDLRWPKVGTHWKAGEAHLQLLLVGSP